MRISLFILTLEEQEMTALEIFLIGVGLSMDAFAVSICKGLSVGRVNFKHMVIAGLWFGGFQALMPLIGYLLGSTFEQYVTSIDHWIAFILLSIIGANMIKESFDKDSEKQNASFSFMSMLMVAVATSIDALAVGITFAFLQVNIWLAIAVIGCTTFVISAAGIKIGSVFGAKYKAKAEFFGGAVLICLGIKILVEHLFFS